MTNLMRRLPMAVLILPMMLFNSTMGFAEQFRVGIRAANDQQGHLAYSRVYVLILNDIAKITGDTFEFIHLPPIRVKKYFNEGKIDIEAATNLVWRKNEAIPGVFTIAFSQNISIILLNKNKQKQLRPIQHLRGKPIGTVRGFSYPTLAPLFANGALQRFDEADELSLIKSVLAGRLDQVVISKHIAVRWSEQNNAQEKLFFGEVLDTQPVMMRLHPQATRLLSRMNKAIRQMIDSGQMTRRTGVPMK